ncbi:transcriptional repressor LexA [Chloroflexota bacterium]
MSVSDKRTRIMKFIKEFIDDRGYAPTIAEIQSGCEISSKSVVEYHLKALEREGRIKRDAELSRAIEITGMGKRALTIPLLGEIAAGQPIPIPTEDTWHMVVQETVEVPAEMLPTGVQAYALRVKGTSMIDALVGDRDIVILEVINTADDGDMVVAWLTERQEATLKKLYREPGRIRLQPANQGMAPIYVDSDKVEIQGRVIAVLRRYITG